MQKVHFSQVIDPLWEAYEDSLDKNLIKNTPENIWELQKYSLALYQFIDTIDVSERVYVH